MSVCVFARKKTTKKRFGDGQKYNNFWKRTHFLEVSVSGFADRHRVFDQKVPKTILKSVFFEASVECIARFPS